MDIGVVILGVVVVLAILNTERQAAALRRDLARMDRKLGVLLKQMGVAYEDSFALSERVKDIARDPNRKIEAIKAYREETGAGLKDAKDAVEAYIDAVTR